jgi:hypothetical protein
MSCSRDWRTVGPLLGMAAAGVIMSEVHAEEPEPLDEEFLDYLLQLEGDEEDWTLFDSQESEPAPASSTTSKPAPTKEPVAKSTPSAPAQSAPAKTQTEAKR